MSRFKIDGSVPDVIKKHIKETLFDVWDNIKNETRIHYIIPPNEDNRDYQTVKLLVSDNPDMKNAWVQAEKMRLSDTDLIKLFDNAWQYNLDYAEYRLIKSEGIPNQSNENKKTVPSPQKLVRDIEYHASSLIKTITELDGCWPKNHRNPDKNIYDEVLISLLEDCSLKARLLIANNVSSHTPIVEAVRSQKSSPKNEYARAFICALGKNGFPLRTSNMSTLLASVITAVLTSKDEQISTSEVWAIIEDFYKKKPK